jgi:hypothetical protein
VSLPENAGSPVRQPGPEQTATITTQPHRGYNETSTDVDDVLAEIRRWESAARVIADDRALSKRQKCAALLDMAFRARRRDTAVFLETAIWRGSRHFFEGDRKVPRDVIEANRRLIRRGLDHCPECRRPLPSSADLDRWRELGHDLRRPA